MGSRDLLINLIGKDTSASAVLGGLGKKAEETGKKTESFGAMSTKALAAVGVAAVGVAMKSADTFNRLGGEVLKLQRYTGATAEEASGLRYAAQQTGTDVDSLSKALGIASKNMLKSKDAAKEFGVAIKDQAGQTRPMHDVLLDMADRFKSMPAGADKTALALKTFGRAGADMIPLLNKGSAGIAELEAKAKTLGLVFDDEALNKVKAYKAAQRDLTASFDALQVKIGGAVVPMLTTVTQTFAKIPGPVADVIAPVTGAGVALLGMAAAGQKVWSIAGPAVDKLKTWNAAMRESGDSASGGGVKIAGLAVAIGAVVAATAKMKADSAETSSAIFKGLDFTDLEAANSKLNETGQTINAMGAKWDSYTTAEKLFHAEDYKLWQDAAAQQEEHRKHLDASIAATHGLADALGITARDAESLAAELHIDPAAVPFDVLLDTMTRYRAGTITTAEAQDKLRGSTDAATDAIKSQADEMRAEVDPLFAMTKALNGNREAQEKVEKLTRDVTQAQKDYDYAVLTTLPTSQQQKDAYDKLAAAQDALTNANGDAVRSALDVTSAQGALEKAVRDGTTSVEGGIAVLSRWVQQGLITQTQADETAESFNYAGVQVDELAGKHANPTVNAPGLDETIWKLAVLKGQIESIPKRLNIAEVKDRSFSSHASGGSLTEGWNRLGEHGAEMAYKQGSNVYVSGAGASASRGGGGSLNVYVTVQGAVQTERDLVESVRNGLIDTLRTNPSLFTPA